jgi:transcriptional regulator with XRE-family HTH domain
MSRTRAPRTSIERLGARQAREARRSVASEVERAREDAGLSVRRLAAAAGISHATLLSIEQGIHDPTTEVVGRLATALGMSLSVRLYPGTGPIIRDRHQSAMLGGLIRVLHPRWRPRSEVAVYRPVRGVVDLVLDASDEPIVACEAESELRRIEQQVRWARAKADALAIARGTDEHTQGRPVRRLLLLRSTTRNRAVVAQYADVVAAAYPARAIDAYAALTGNAPWPGDALLWCRIEDDQATVLDRPPRGIRVGRDGRPSGETGADHGRRESQ